MRFYRNLGGNSRRPINYLPATSSSYRSSEKANEQRIIGDQNFYMKRKTKFCLVLFRKNIGSYFETIRGKEKFRKLLCKGHPP